MVIDFRQNNNMITQNTIINNETIELVNDYRYLGTIFSHNLSWDLNTDSIIKKANQLS